MTAVEMVIHLRHLARKGQIPSGQAMFDYLADHMHLARLSSGGRLLDASDFKQFLRELGEASAPRLQHKPIARIDHVRTWPSGGNALLVHDFSGAAEQRCPRCSHVHQGVTQCSTDLGDGRICRCELPVPA